jgi:hypothetical protein
MNSVRAFNEDIKNVVKEEVVECMAAFLHYLGREKLKIWHDDFFEVFPGRHPKWHQPRENKTRR